MLTKLFAFFLCFSCIAAYSQDEAVITAKLGSAPNDTTAVLVEPYSGESYTAVIRDHQFKFNVPLPKGGSVYILSIGSVPDTTFNLATIVYLEKGHLNINGNGGFLTATYSGDAWATEWQEIMKVTDPAKEDNKQIAALEEKFEKAVKVGDEDAVEDYKKQLDGKKNVQKEIFRKWILAHPNSGVCGYLITVFFGQDPQREELYAGLTDHAKSSRILRRWKNPGKIDASPLQLKVDKGGAAPKIAGNVTAGDTAPAFSIPDVNGKKVSLSDFKGKYVFLDFWASWCVPCQPQIPFLKAANDKFKNKNFVMVSVSLDSKKEDWVKAMQKHQIDWVNVSSFKGWADDAAAAYGATYIPSNVLIGPDGKVIARDLYDGNIEKKLAEVIK